MQKLSLLFLVLLAASAVEQTEARRCNSCHKESSGCRALEALIDHTVFVDPRYGDDRTGRVQNPFLPFRTIGDAIEAAADAGASPVAVWQIQIRPGAYHETVSLQSCINLLGLSTLGGTQDNGPEVQLFGSINDAGLNPLIDCSPDITGVNVYATNTPAATFTAGVDINVLGSIFNTTYTTSQSSTGSSVVLGGGAEYSFERDTIAINGAGLLSAVTLATTGTTTSLLELSGGEITVSVTGTYNATFVTVTGTDPVFTLSNYRRLISHNQYYVLEDNTGANGGATLFSLDDAVAVSTADIFQLFLGGDVKVPPTLTLANLDPTVGVNQQINIESMVVDFVPAASALHVQNFYLANNHAHLNSSVFIQNIRLRGWSRPIPTQTPSEFGNPIRVVGILTDVEQGGQGLVGVRTFATNTTVHDLDQVLIYVGAPHAGQITLPLAYANKGRVLTFKVGATGVPPLLIKALPGNFIDDGRSQFALTTRSTSYTLVSDGGTHWYSISGATGAA